MLVLRYTGFESDAGGEESYILITIYSCIVEQGLQASLFPYVPIHAFSRAS